MVKVGFTVDPSPNPYSINFTPLTTLFAGIWHLISTRPFMVLSLYRHLHVKALPLESTFTSVHTKKTTSSHQITSTQYNHDHAEISWFQDWEYHHHEWMTQVSDVSWSQTYWLTKLARPGNKGCYLMRACARVLWRAEGKRRACEAIANPDLC